MISSSDSGTESSRHFGGQDFSAEEGAKSSSVFIFMLHHYRTHNLGMSFSNVTSLN